MKNRKREDHRGRKSRLLANYPFLSLSTGGEKGDIVSFAWQQTLHPFLFATTIGQKKVIFNRDFGKRFFRFLCKFVSHFAAADWTTVVAKETK